MPDKREILLSQIKNSSPAEFETLVLEFLLKIESSEYGEVTGRTGDEGIDGFIRLDTLGLGLVYFQAKRWDETVVGRPEIQKFVGALHGKKGSAGVFVTASSFTKEAQEYVKHLELKIRLIDGEELVNLMVKNSLEHLVKTDPNSLLSIESKATHNEIILNEKGYLLMGDGAKILNHLIFEGFPLEDIFDKSLEIMESIYDFPPEKRFLIFETTGIFVKETKTKQDALEILNDQRVLYYRIKNLEDAPIGAKLPTKEDEEDRLYGKAVEMVKTERKASATFLERRLQIGYSRAARLIDQMETNGIVGPAEGEKPRKVF